MQILHQSIVTDVLFAQISCRCYLRQEGIQDTNPLEGWVVGKSCPVKIECAHVCQLLTLSWTGDTCVALTEGVSFITEGKLPVCN